ncbi:MULTISPECIES: pyocin activator PrtN family protein [Aeromonas]|uniref:pyocin activator PrtN family protein n=1 Tax=Aeromonas TaxID=642 RepID=UPI0012389CEF|nr:pyocin activator PrtN family protein [Aeromonas veronii]EKP0300250.1 pyocin activator PrtN family protein [Aeromonas veronii]MCO4171848.1 pyocin activator PrtN family protein [Aeromonas veronii]MCX0429701.1 pyocin activator PrtN family protein [Aeromonas veronii]QET79864.1 pyocin activator protein PrtN [Aeromonas veronii]UYB71547.1 pyocin activator PrtN family protein [Aeromonas veronii]
MNTVFLLMAQFNAATIPLSQIAESLLGLKPATAETHARTGRLPFPTFRMGESQKSPRLVHVKDLAEFIDNRRKEASEEYAHCQ